jgi:hypothetical protein
MPIFCWWLVRGETAMVIYLHTYFRGAAFTYSGIISGVCGLPEASLYNFEVALTVITEVRPLGAVGNVLQIIPRENTLRVVCILTSHSIYDKSNAGLNPLQGNLNHFRESWLHRAYVSNAITIGQARVLVHLSRVVAKMSQSSKGPSGGVQCRSYGKV